MNDTLVRANTISLTVAIRRFAIHFLEMCVAMCVGGAALSFAVFGLATLVGYPNLVAQAPELSILIIAGDFALAMAIYMALRGHAVRHNVEMSGSAVAGAIPLIGALWLGMIPEATFETWRSLALFVCGPLCLLMLVVMLVRFDHYGGQIGASVAVASSGAGEYTCPMHPEVRLAQPGVCPVCGMKLKTAAMRSRSRAEAEVGRFLRPFLELQLAMAFGALVCFLLGGLVRASSIDATGYQPGTVLFFLGDVGFLTAPVVAWMILRGRKWRYSLELAATMLAPVGAIVAVGELTGSAYLLWLVTAMYPAMSFGMLAYMLYRANLVDRGRNVVTELAS